MVAILVAATTMTIALLLHGESAHPYEQTQTATSGPDVVASVFPAPDAQISSQQLSSLNALNRAAGVVAHSGPYPVTWTTLKRGTNSVGAEVEGRDIGSAAVDQPALISGTWLRSGGAVVERTFAQALGLHVGDPVTLGDTTLHITGIAVTAAFTPYPQLCADGCALVTQQLQNANPGLIWVPRAELEHVTVLGEPLTYYDNLRLSDPAGAQAFADRHTAPASILSPSLTTGQQISAQDADLIHDEQTALIVGSWLLGVLALATVTVLVGTRLSDQNRRVGLLKAVGATPGLVSSILLAEYLALAVAGAAGGLLLGRLVAPLLTKPGAGLLGTAGAPPLNMLDVALVLGTAVALTGLATFVPATRAARTGTVHALTDPARPPRRVRPLIAVSARLPVPLLLGLRLLARRPRRAILATIAVTVAVAGIVVIMFAQTNLTVHQQSTAGLSDPRNQRLGQVMLALTILLALMATVNLIFVAVATAVDARTSMAITRAVGATPNQVTLGLALAQVTPAVIGALIGLPAGAALFAALSQTNATSGPPWWWLAALVPATTVLAATITAVPARAGARQPIAGILQAEQA